MKQEQASKDGEWAFTPAGENQQPMSLDDAQSCQQVMDSKDCEHLQLPPEYAGKYAQKLNLRGYGFGTYRIHDAPLNMSARQTGLFYRLSRRVSIWIRNMPGSFSSSKTDKA
jgi:hypothetical protein